MEPGGIETAVQLRMAQLLRSSILLADLANNGGARRDRTADLYNAIVALSQLSYGPFKTAARKGGYFNGSPKHGQDRIDRSGHHP